MKPPWMAWVRSCSAPGEWFMKTALERELPPMSFIMSKYCVTSSKSITYGQQERLARKERSPRAAGRAARRSPRNKKESRGRGRKDGRPTAWCSSGSVACFESTPATSALKQLTESRSPDTIACRCRAMPWPCMNLASASALAWISVRAASASASLIERILIASPSSTAAWRSRFALLISFIARLTSMFGSMSVTGVARME
mmetsp:Transcript_8559/g.25261  ORF Transcript_8559/g.25261 Transcript_8559/m.25261 type:complete len:201 (+) Transcript_8559:413-1015(+)